jgi:hypothetical protein
MIIKKFLGDLPDNIRCNYFLDSEHCRDLAKKIYETPRQVIYECPSDYKKYEYRKTEEGAWLLYDEWQDEDRTYTNIERVYSGRIDCKHTLLEAA